MPAYWLKTKTGNVCVEVYDMGVGIDAATEAVRLALADGRDQIEILGTLPYPANPRLTKGACPAFCHDPNTCVGHGSCPKEYACND